MPPSPSGPDIDPRSGYCAATRTFHSLRSPAPLPPPDLPLSFPAFALSFLPDPLPPSSRPALVDAGTGAAVPFPAFLSRTRALAAALRARVRLAPGDVAFVLAPAGVHVPVLYYALMAVGAVVSLAQYLQLAKGVWSYGDYIRFLPCCWRRRKRANWIRGPGELWVRGPFVMKGYLGEKDSTSEILDNEGWLRTGDVCYIDQDGFIYIVDRLKELIKYKGYQVPPAELENLLQTHPDIDEAAVVPYPDDEAGELPVAFIVRRPGSRLHESHIKEFVAKQVVHYKRIHHVFLVDSIPENATGKILRKDLAKLALWRISSKL